MTYHIDGSRLWDDLMKMAEVGGTPKGGCDRQALSDDDIAGRALLASWCAPYGFQIAYDAAGNMFIRLPGTNEALPPILMGSHLDTQKTGGKFDGILGVLAGFEVLRCLAENGIKPRRSVEVAAWMNEEGSRFAPAMMGSGIFAGMLELEYVRSIRDDDGVTVGEELDRHGYSSGPDPTDKAVHAYLELHIEQGPVLEQREKTIGVVTGAQAIRWYDVRVTGQSVHAGPFPMEMRKDPIALLPRLIDGVMRIGNTDRDARATIGRLSANPGSRNVVPADIELSVDLRHPDEKILTTMHEAFVQLLKELKADNASLNLSHNLIWHSPAVRFDEQLVSYVRSSATDKELSHINIISGAGHDALMVARRVPTAMIFIPCDGGLSHNELENATPSDVAAGADVLLSSILKVLED